MRLLTFSRTDKAPSQLHTQRLLLRAPDASDFESWANVRAASADFLRPWEPQWHPSELSRPVWRSWMRRNEAGINSGRTLPWFLFDAADPENLLGGITVSNIRRGIAQTGTVGYWMSKEASGQGYMREALEAVCAEAFGNLALERLEAAIVPDNERSERLLLRCGFEREGFARNYLEIAGYRRDHVLFARIADGA